VAPLESGAASVVPSSNVTSPRSKAAVVAAVFEARAEFTLADDSEAAVAPSLLSRDAVDEAEPDSTPRRSEKAVTPLCNPAVNPSAETPLADNSTAPPCEVAATLATSRLNVPAAFSMTIISTFPPTETKDEPSPLDSPLVDRL
jgi:hypothetical protein